jgi:chromatin assembly factor 1 subunit B
MYHDDTMKSFFRRMSFSPDGSLLFTPAGCLDIEMKTTNASFIYKKSSYNRLLKLIKNFMEIKNFN